MENRNLLLFDFNNLAHSVVHLPGVKAETAYPAWDFAAYLMFNAVYEFIQRIIADTDEAASVWDVVLALDNAEGGYWRKDIYPPYKANRAARRRESPINWDEAYGHINSLVSDMAAYLPWKILKTPRCEADDIIAVLCAHTRYDRAVVYSADSDYAQLCGEKVFVFSPRKGEYLEFPGVFRISGEDVYCPDTETFLQYSVLTGQGGKDNVYNVKTASDWDIEKRKPGFGVVAARKALEGNLETWMGESGLRDNYFRNLALIDLRLIPAEYVYSILQGYERYGDKQPDVRGFLGKRAWPSLLSGLAMEAAEDLILGAAGLRNFSGMAEGVSEPAEVGLDFVL